jgi:hypothetical protein
MLGKGRCCAQQQRYCVMHGARLWRVVVPGFSIRSDCRAQMRIPVLFFMLHDGQLFLADAVQVSPLLKQKWSKPQTQNPLNHRV